MTEQQFETIQEWSMNQKYEKEDVAFSSIDGFPNHVVSSSGRVFVRSYTDLNGRVRKEKELTQATTLDGYKTVWLTHQGHAVTTRVHRIVGMAFIPNPYNKPTINHKDGVKENNQFYNLEWADASEQMTHAYKMGLKEVSQVGKTQQLRKGGKPVRCFNKKTGLVSYHVSARECSSYASMSERWCDKMIGSQGGETKDYKMEYITFEELQDPKNTKSLQSVVELIRMWSIDKGLNKSSPQSQLIKVFEEVGEVAGAFSKGDEEEMKLEIGDVMVTLIIFAQQQNIDFEACIHSAYMKIKDRRGKMINGIFVKESDLVKE